MMQRIATTWMTWIVAGALAASSAPAAAAPPPETKTEATVGVPPPLPPEDEAPEGDAPKDKQPAPTDEALDKGTPEDTDVPGPGAGTPDPFRQSSIEEAASHFVEGRWLFTRRDYVAAATEFERSYSAYPSGEALYNGALSYEKGGRPVDALQACQRYLALDDCNSAADLHCARKRDEVTKTAKRLRGRVGVLEIGVEPGVELAAVQVDGVEIPLDEFPIFLEPRTVVVRLVGKKEGQLRSRTAKLEAGERTSLLVGPFADPSVRDRVPEPVVENPELPPRVDPAVRRRRLRIAFWSGLGLTVASGASIIVLGTLTTRFKRRIDGRCRGEGVDCSDTVHPEDDIATFDRLRPATNAMIGVTAGVGMITAIVGVFAFSGKAGNSRRASVTKRHFGLGANQLTVRW